LCSAPRRDCTSGQPAKIYDSSDYLEGLKAFAEKRKPNFHGT